MNLQIQTHLNIPELEMSSDLVTDLIAEFSQVIVKAGLGNKADADGNIDCIIIIKGEELENTLEFLEEIVKDAWGITLPTDDQSFVERSIKEGFQVEQ